jgi:flagellar basal body-associated protein FliL
MMSHWLRNWLKSQKQTRRFHPSWILLVVVITLIVAGIIWIPATLVSKAKKVGYEYERLPAAQTLSAPANNAAHAKEEEAPATVEPFPLPARSGPKTIRVKFSGYPGRSIDIV